ncbi:1-aminocyclopropane-1-carboxylate synthase-like protein 1 [Trichonephila clavipes]|nr:1-aminocyclopropane-1-carboxylate synthase-like protein 1 [Trichonephila clavipes]
MQILVRHNLHVIVDEIYALSTFEGSPQFHSALKFPDLPNKEKVHVLYGISKDFGIAGLRVGVIHTQNKAVQNCLKQLCVYQVIPFPIMDITARFIEDLGNSPDLNPIENLWLRLKTLVQMRYPWNKKELIEDVIVSCHHVITKEELKTIFSSIKHRCEAVIKIKGNLAKF